MQPFRDDRAREQYENWVSWYRQTIKALAELKMSAYLRKKEADEQRMQGIREGNLRERRLRIYQKLKREFEEGETPEPVPLDEETLKQVEKDLKDRWGHHWEWIDGQWLQKQPEILKEINDV